MVVRGKRARILFGSAVVRNRNSRHNILGGLYEWSAVGLVHRRRACGRLKKLEPSVSLCQLAMLHAPEVITHNIRHDGTGKERQRRVQD